MKILYLGEISPGQTARMRMRALERLGHEVVGLNTVQPWREAGWLLRQWQRRLARGSVVDGINGSVIEAARDFRPELVWADKQEFLRAETVNGLRRLGAKTVHFTPDPYFFLSWKQTSLMNEAMRVFDLLAYCKIYERSDYEALGKSLIYLPLGCCDEVHRPMPPTIHPRYARSNSTAVGNRTVSFWSNSPAKLPSRTGVIPCSLLVFGTTRSTATPMPAPHRIANRVRLSSQGLSRPTHHPHVQDSRLWQSAAGGPHRRTTRTLRRRQRGRILERRIRVGRQGEVLHHLRSGTGKSRRRPSALP